MLELSRGLQGVGGAAMFSVSLALLANAFRGKDRGIAFGVWGAITGLAVAVGPVGRRRAGHRHLLAVDLLRQPAHRPARLRPDRDAGARVPRRQQAHRPDWAGFVLFSGGAGLPRLRAHRVGAQRLQRDAGGRLLRRRRRCCWSPSSSSSGAVAQPMFDLSLFRLPTFAGGDIAAFGVSAGDLLGAPVPRPLPAGRARLSARCRPACAR